MFVFITLSKKIDFKEKNFKIRDKKSYTVVLKLAFKNHSKGMPNYSIFDVAGPIMVGPSSSHTAGACKLGQIARALFHGTPEKVTFILHGSFATVYKGHATDRALLGGVMKFKTSDPEIKNSFQIAEHAGLKYSFETADLGEKYHPNTVKIILEKEGRRPMSMIGCSIGGGIVNVVQIDQFEVNLENVASQWKTFIVWHKNKPHLLKDFNDELKKLGSFIHNKQTVTVGEHSLSVINLDGNELTLSEVLELEKIDGIEDVRSLISLKE